MRFPEKYRLGAGAPFGRESGPGERHGAFLIPPSLSLRRPVALRVIATSGEDWYEACMAQGLDPNSTPWEHVSVTLQPPLMTRCPTWEEMCFVKGLFWEPEDAVIQIHPPDSEYVSESRFCLHLWRPVGIELPRPPAMCVGTVKKYA